MTLSKITRAQEESPRSQSGYPTTIHSSLNWPKHVQKHPKNITLCAGRDSDRCYIGTSQSSSPTTKAACIGKKSVKKHPQHVTFCFCRGPDRCYIGNQPLYFQWVSLSKDIGAQEGIFISQNDPPTTKVAWIGQIWDLFWIPQPKLHGAMYLIVL